MTSQQLLTIILVAIVANAVLIVIALATMRSNRSRGAEIPEVDVNATHDTMVAMASAGGAFPSQAGVMAGTVPSSDSTAGEWPAHAAPSPANDEGEDTNAEPAIEPLEAQAELESPAAWRRAVEDEVVRLMRYHRPATVIILELDGFERLVDRLGEAAGERLLVATARTLRAQARAADRCARFGRGRFAILLPETDDIKAINFAERVRSECDRWLEAGEIALRLAIGWATLDATDGAAAAIQTAERRMDAERRHRGGSTA